MNTEIAFALLVAYATGGDLALRQAAKQLAAEESAAGHSRVAEEILDLLRDWATKSDPSTPAPALLPVRS